MADIIPLVPVEEMERRQRRANSVNPELWDVLDVVMDPEIPVISIYELGVLQNVELVDGVVVITMTPTYIGCPAMNIMAEDAHEALEKAGYSEVRVDTKLSPAWTTSWLTAEARAKMQRYGVAAPEDEKAHCPQCGSAHVEPISEFGSTACKALYKCRDCGEPFDYFKAI